MAALESVLQALDGKTFPRVLFETGEPFQRVVRIPSRVADRRVHGFGAKEVPAVDPRNSAPIGDAVNDARQVLVGDSDSKLSPPGRHQEIAVARLLTVRSVPSRRWRKSWTRSLPRLPDVSPGGCFVAG